MPLHLKRRGRGGAEEIVESEFESLTVFCRKSVRGSCLCVIVTRWLHLSAFPRLLRDLRVSNAAASSPMVELSEKSQFFCRLSTIGVRCGVSREDLNTTFSKVFMGQVW